MQMIEIKSKTEFKWTINILINFKTNKLDFINLLFDL